MKFLQISATSTGAARKKSVLPLRMKKKKQQTEVSHCGLTIRISATASRNKKNGRVYKSYQLTDYSSGVRKRLTFSDLEEAKKSARGLAEAKANGRRHTLDWDAKTHAQVHRALEFASATGLTVDGICQRFVDAVNVLGGNQNLLLPAVYFFKEKANNEVLLPKKVNEAAVAFLAEQAPEISLRRQLTNASYMRQFGLVFGGRWTHEIQTSEIRDRTIAKKYSLATRNDMLNFLSQFFKHLRSRAGVRQGARPGDGQHCRGHQASERG